MREHIFTYPLLIVLLFMGCAGNNSTKLPENTDDKAILERAEQLYNRKKYQRTLELLDKIRYTASVYADDAHLLAAKVYIAQKQYDMATSELKWLLGQYPQSKLCEEASFLLGEAYRKASPRAELDQEYTQRAISAYNDFLDRYPASQFADSASNGILACREKLAYKQYLSAELYYKMRQDSSAIIYISDIRSRYSDTKWKLWSDYLEARIRIRQNKLDMAKSLLSDILSSADDEKLRKKAQKALRKIEN